MAERPRWLSYSAKEGILTSHFEEDEDSLTSFFQRALEWSHGNNTAGNRTLRILDTFLSSKADYSLLESATREAANGAGLQILLAQPTSAFAQARSQSLASTPESRTRQGLHHIAEAVLSLHEGSSPDLHSLTLTDLLDLIRDKAAKWPLEIRFYDDFPSGPMYFLSGLVLVGRYTAGLSAHRSPWLLVVKAPDCDGDLYDKLAGEFNSLWKHGESTIKSWDDSTAPPTLSLVEPDAAEVVADVCGRFQTVVSQLDGRVQLLAELDITKLLAALLRLYFDTVHLEEPTPTYVDQSGRVDIYLPDAGVGIEVKFVREGRNKTQILNELLVAQQRYAQHTEIRVLVLFVYDPAHTIVNRSRIARDLAAANGVTTRVIFTP